MSWEPDYVTLAEAKSYLRIDDTVDDALLATWITTASRAVDTFCHRQFGQVSPAEARTYRGTWDRHIGCYVVAIDDLQDITGMTVTAGATPVVVTSYTLEPLNGPQKGRPYERLLATAGGPMTILAKWGWSAVPVPVKNATLIQTARFAFRRDSPHGIAGSPSEGSEQRLLAALDPDLKTSLGSKYRREWWAA